jgi:anti-anti-sigma factor
MATVTLDPKLDVFNLAAVESVLDPLLEVSETVINASKVEQCDYCGIQMLVSFMKTVSKNGHSVSVEEPSDRFIDAVVILGLEEEFNIMDKYYG